MQDWQFGDADARPGTEALTVLFMPFRWTWGALTEKRHGGLLNLIIEIGLGTLQIHRVCLLY